MSWWTGFIVVYLAAAVSASPVKPHRRYITYGDCYNSTMPKEFDLAKFTTDSWYEISKLRNEFEVNADCIRLDFFQSDTDLTLTFSAHFINYTEGVIYAPGTLELTGTELNIQVSFPGDAEPMKLSVLKTDFDNYALLYSCKQISDDIISEKEERAWVLSRKPYFDKPIQEIVDEVLNEYSDISIFLDDTNQFCKPGC